MAGPGFAEAAQSPFTADPKSLVGQFRRFGEFGPAYEVLRVVDENTVFIHVYTNDEELNYPIREVLSDPLTETIP